MAAHARRVVGALLLVCRVQVGHHDGQVQREEPHVEVGQDQVAAMDALHLTTIDHELDQDVHLVVQPGRGGSTRGGEVG